MSVNKVILVGNVGQPPEVRTMNNGDLVANLSVATTEKWKDKNTGEKKEYTEWHKVVAFGVPAKFIESYVNTGDKVYVEGQLKTRSWEKDGQKRYTTEVVVQGFSSKLEKLNRSDLSGSQSSQSFNSSELGDEIPFN